MMVEIKLNIRGKFSCAAIAAQWVDRLFPKPRFVDSTSTWREFIKGFYFYYSLWILLNVLYYRGNKNAIPFHKQDREHHLDEYKVESTHYSWQTEFRQVRFQSMDSEITT